MSKLILLRFVKFLSDFLIPDSFEIVYSDTDSMCLVLEDKMSALVRPEMRQFWEEAQKEWFVQDHNDAWDLRCPGKMKREWESSNGSIIWYVNSLSLCFIDSGDLVDLINSINT